uniref:Amidohydrolase-related domain-containing protein n=1 Tax=Fusarium oxysporum (strain Fo5176) TaxID=660025 RepID=A0A0D2YDG5_FUSOF
MDIQKAVVEAAHKAGVIAVGHALGYAGAKDLFDAGVDGLTHCFLDKPPSDDFIDIMLTRNIHCNPTLVLCASQTVERQEWQREFRKDPLADRMMLPRKMYQAGITLVAGSDAGGQEFGVAYGLGMHIEMYLLKHEIGMTLEDVLKAATSNVAKRFGFNDRGEIAVGKKADFVLLKGDADSVLSDIQQGCLPVEGVWRDGVLANVYEERFPEFSLKRDED